MLFHTLLHPPFPWERGKGGCVEKKKNLFSQKFESKIWKRSVWRRERRVCRGPLGRCDGPCPRRPDGRCSGNTGRLVLASDWGTVLAMGTNPHVSCQDAKEYWNRRNWHSWHIGGSLLCQGHGRRRAPLAVCAYFPLHTSSVSSVFDDLSFLQWCCPDRKLTLHHTTHTAGTTFLFSRDTYRGAKLRDSEVD